MVSQRKSGLSSYARFLALAAALLVPSAAAYAQEELVVSAFGGGWERAMRTTVVEPFEKKFNVRVTVAVPGVSSAILARLRAEKGNPSMDAVIIGGGLEAVAASEGLMETLNLDNIPNFQDLLPEAVGPANYGPSIATSGTGIAYNSELMPTPPTSWLDFWDPDLAGKIGIMNADSNFGVAHFALVNAELGGDFDNVEPGFEKFGELMASKPIILRNVDDSVNALTQRGASMVVMTNSRVIQLAEEGFPVKMAYPEEGAFAWGNYIGIPVGSKNKELAEKFINFFLEPEIQRDWAMAVGYGPTNSKTELPADYAYTDVLQMPKIYDLDLEAMNARRGDWLERWNKETLSLLQ